MLEVKNLSCKVKNIDKTILSDFNLKINDGEVHVIMGPNGTGKSTLSKMIMGHYQYEIIDGQIFFNDQDITSFNTSDRAKKGIFLAMQDPTVIEGVSNSEFLKEAVGEVRGEKVNLYRFITEMNNGIQNLHLSSDMLHRSINSGFSGGEKKKNEVLQLRVLKPKFIILDELDSGLDVDSLNIVCSNINQYLEENKNVSVLIITHYPRILEYIHPDYVHILNKGRIVQTGDYSLAKKIEKYGYQGINELGKNDFHE